MNTSIFSSPRSEYSLLHIMMFSWKNCLIFQTNSCDNIKCSASFSKVIEGEFERIRAKGYDERRGCSFDLCRRSERKKTDRQLINLMTVGPQSVCVCVCFVAKDESSSKFSVSLQRCFTLHSDRWKVSLKHTHTHRKCCTWSNDG